MDLHSLGYRIPHHGERDSRGFEGSKSFWRKRNRIEKQDGKMVRKRRQVMGEFWRENEGKMKGEGENNQARPLLRPWTGFEA